MHTPLVFRQQVVLHMSAIALICSSFPMAIKIIASFFWSWLNFSSEFRLPLEEASCRVSSVWNGSHYHFTSRRDGHGSVSIPAVPVSTSAGEELRGHTRIVSCSSVKLLSASNVADPLEACHTESFEAINSSSQGGMRKEEWKEWCSIWRVLCLSRTIT